MAQVTVTIDGKAYRMACDEGQESHLVGLAQNFDQYVTHLKRQFGEIGDLRITVMAAIMVMDELFEANRKTSELEAAIEEIRRTRDGLEAATQKSDETVASLIGELTRQVRAISTKLESGKETG